MRTLSIVVALIGLTGSPLHAQNDITQPNQTSKPNDTSKSTTNQIESSASLITIETAINAFNQHQLDTAKTQFEFLLSKAPYDPAVNFYLGKIAFNKNRYEEAEGYLVRAVEVESDNPEYLSSLGENYFKLADQASIFSKMSTLAKGRDVLIRAYQLDANHIVTIQSLGHFYLTASKLIGGDPDKAVSLFTQLTKITPDKPEAYDNLGKSLLTTENYQAAKAAFEQALMLEPSLQSSLRGLKEAEQAQLD